MKKRIPALLLAVGIAASPIYAKNQNRRSAGKATSGLNNKAEKATKSNAKKFLMIEAEKELIKEMDEEISNVLSTIETADNREVNSKASTSNAGFVLKDDIPNNGLDLSMEFKALKRESYL